MKFLIVADLKPYGLAKPNREKKKKKNSSVLITALLQIHFARAQLKY